MLVNLRLNMFIVELFCGMKNELINQNVHHKFNFLYVAKREKYNYLSYKDLQKC